MNGEGDDLLGRAGRGDRDALARLLEKLGPAVRRSLNGKIPRRWRAVLSDDDVMQQTYADAIAQIARIRADSEDAFTGWLVVTAQHNLQDAVKMLEADKRGGQRRRVEPVGPDGTPLRLSELLPGTGTTPSGQAARGEAGTALQRALTRLPATYARVVRLYDLEGRPVQEVAAELKRSPGAVFMLRIRAHERLRELLGNTSNFFTR